MGLGEGEGKKITHHSRLRESDAACIGSPYLDELAVVGPWARQNIVSLLGLQPSTCCFSKP